MLGDGPDNAQLPMDASWGWAGVLIVSIWGFGQTGVKQSKGRVDEEDRQR